MIRYYILKININVKRMKLFTVYLYYFISFKKQSSKNEIIKDDILHRKWLISKSVIFNLYFYRF